MIAVPAALAVHALFGFPSAAAEVPPSLRLGDFTVVFAETRLSQLREAVGAGIVDRQDGLFWLCYTALHGGGAQRVWVTSGEQQRGVEADSFTAETLGEDQGPSPACPALPPRFMPLTMSNGVWLGMTLADMERKTGAKAWRAGSYFEFSARGPDGVLSASAHRIVVEVSENRVVRLWVHKPPAP